MITLLLFISSFAWADTSGTFDVSAHTLSKEELAEMAKTHCKEVERHASDGCNTCRCTRCTDGKKQWDEPVCSCTAMFCSHHMGEQDYNPNDWKDTK